MALNSPIREMNLAPRETRLGDDAASYVSLLTRRAAGTIIFRTGAGRIFRDLLIHWPMLEGQEAEAQRLCNRIADAVYPLVASLYAQAVEIVVTISPQPIPPPARVEAMESYVVFDSSDGFERLFFLSPEQDLPSIDLMTAKEGIVVSGRPLNYRYHTIKDDRRPYRGVHTGMFEIPERLLNTLLAKHSLTEADDQILKLVRMKLYILPDILKNYFVARDMVLTPQDQTGPFAREISTMTSLSSLPPPVRAFEHQLMAYVTDEKFSPDVRLGLRQVARSLRDMHPQALIEEAAQAEFTPVAHSELAKNAGIGARRSYDRLRKNSLNNFPKTVSSGETGKLQKTAYAQTARNSKARSFPTPSPDPYPYVPGSSAG